MTENSRGLWASLWRFLRSWQAAAAVGVILVLALLWWVRPQRIERVVSVEGPEWDAADAPARRQVAWAQVRGLEVPLPEGRAGKLISPRLTDAGGTLYFTFRDADGNADIYRSRLLDGRWQPAEAVAELNSAADDIGPAFSADGRELYFYSNRPGGLGGFDLYVSRREGGRWTAPRNLGPSVNSPAHEYDPALAPDGQSLYFSSNRTAEMGRQAAQKPEAEKDKQWAATLRSHPGLTQFDLYVARRTAEQGWAVPEPLTELNLPTSNEGAPFVSPNGKFLYFASDRPVREGEPPNLDLYRARLVEGRPTAPEALGPSINTAAHETEPALSPEGYTLVFSSNRNGTDSLFLSTAEEVYGATGYATTRWDAFAAVWWKVLLLTLVTGALLAVIFFRRGWIMEKAILARFVAASLLLHLLLVMYLWVTPLHEVLVEVAQIISGEPAPQLFDDPNQAAPQHDPFGARAELPELERPADPELARQAAAPSEAKLAPDTPLDLPAPARKALQPERVQFKSPDPAPLERRPLELPRQAKLELKPAPEIEPVPPPPAAEAGPKEKAPTATQVALARQETAAPTPAMRALPASSPEVRLPRSDLPLPAAKPESPVPPAPTPVVAPLLARAAPAVPPHVAITEKAPVQIVAPAAEPGTKAFDPTAAAVDLARRDMPAPAAARPLPAGPLPNLPGGLPRSSHLLDPVPAVPKTDGPSARQMPERLARLPAKPALVDEPAPVPQPALASEGKPTLKPLPEVEVTVKRPTLNLPDAKIGAVPAALKTPDLPRVALLSRPLPGPAALPVEKAVVDPLGKRLPRLPARDPLLARVAEPTFAQTFMLRKQENREKLVEAFGGNKQSEAAVERGLDWLAQHQSKDGSWSLNQFHVNCQGKHAACGDPGTFVSNTAGTALALLPFFGAGYSQQGGKHQDTVARGLRYLTQKQAADGSLFFPGDTRPMYGQGLAAIVLCEAYGMSKDPALRDPAQRAVNFIVKAQHPTTGGWRYTPGTLGDTSVMGWQVMALKSGELAGLTVPSTAFQGARRWLASVEANKPSGGLFGYTSPAPTPAMTAQGLLSLQLTGARRDDPRMRAGTDYILKNLPNPASDTSYYWYHATQVMYHMQGTHWKAWNDRLRDHLIKTQSVKGALAGSWAPVDARERAGGRICSTALRLLMLEVYYRHLPLYRQLKN
ncbi:MAG: hypothetical protein FJ271_28440 [Planctomycetes bacterium]|nr:hypothetical protein [Planctomycetota bacterium]